MVTKCLEQASANAEKFVWSRDIPAMAAGLLEDNLRSLHLCLNGDASQKEQSVAVIADLNQICVQEITEKDIGE